MHTCKPDGLDLYLSLTPSGLRRLVGDVALTVLTLPRRAADETLEVTLSPLQQAGHQELSCHHREGLVTV